MGKLLIALGALGLLVGGFGYASKWSQVGLLNSIDALLSLGAPARKAASGVSFGSQERQKLDIWVPTAPSKKPRDVIVFFYGGSWNSGDRELYGFVGRALAARGYIVVLPDYRLVPEVRFPGFVEDGAAAVAWVQKNIASYGGNPARINLSGHSAGAHIAALLTLDQHWLKAAGAADHAVHSLAGPYDFLPFTSDASRAAFGQMPDPMPSQPITFARKDAPPMLLLSGSVDTTVKPRNGTALAAAQAKLGAKARTLLYKGLGHSDIIMAVAQPFRSKAPVIDDLAAFFDGVR
jgi:acetyl esterase/lipase